MLAAKDIHKSFGSLEVLKGVSLEIAAGEVVTLVGSSGAGKSTLLQIMGTLDTADQGDILFENKSLMGYTDRQRAHFRNQSLGFVFQFHHLLPEFTALENAAMPALIAGESKQLAFGKAAKLLDQMELSHRLEHKPTELSGGEQQRIAVARAMINQPKFVLADEPTGNLDTANSEALFKIIFELAHQTGIGFLLATHNLQLAEKADRSCRIRDGVIE